MRARCDGHVWWPGVAARCGGQAWPGVAMSGGHVLNSGQGTQGRALHHRGGGPVLNGTPDHSRCQVWWPRCGGQVCGGQEWWPGVVARSGGQAWWPGVARCGQVDGGHGHSAASALAAHPAAGRPVCGRAEPCTVGGLAKFSTGPQPSSVARCGGPGVVALCVVARCSGLVWPGGRCSPHKQPTQPTAGPCGAGQSHAP